MSFALTPSYINMEFTLKWFALFAIFAIVISDFTLPKVKIEVLKPKGVRVSIPDTPGIIGTEFHANINKEIGLREEGDIFNRVRHKTNGSWMFIDNDVELKKGDVLHYWYYVQRGVNGYSQIDLSFQVE